MKNLIYLLIFYFVLSMSVVSCGDNEDKAKAEYTQGLELLNKDKKYNEAGQALLTSLSHQDETQPTTLLAKTYAALSLVYWEQDYNEEAFDYAKKAMICADTLTDDSLKLATINRVASCYYLSGKDDTALIYYKELLTKSISMKNSPMICNAYNNIGAVLISLAKPKDALQYFERGKEFSQGRDKDKAKYHYNRSRCFQNLQQWDSCIQAIRKCLDYSEVNDLEAKQKLYRRLYSAEKHCGHMDAACISADSAFWYSDSVFRFKQREELKSITEKYQQEKYETELVLQRTHWVMVIIIVVFVFLCIFAFIIYRNKKHVVELQKRMESLNLQVTREEQKRENQEEGEWTEEKEENLEQLYLEQWKVSRDIFRQRPAYNKLRQLKYHTDKTYLPDEERLPLIDSVLEVFLDQLQKLRTLYPELTEDECIYAVLIFVGCNNAMASILTKTSEATLRKRRSRFKQKSNEQIFELLMNKE